MTSHEAWLFAGRRLRAGHHTACDICGVTIGSGKEEPILYSKTKRYGHVFMHLNCAQGIYGTMGVTKDDKEKY